VPDAIARVRALVERHPRLWGSLFALLLFAFYVTALRPARMWTAERVVYPILQSVQTEHAARYTLARLPHRPDAVHAIPSAALGDQDPTAFVREHGAAEWAAPIGVLFLLPGMFLLVAFPLRPYWLYLLAYHAVLGLVSFAVFVVGLGWFEPAFQLYLFARTYVAETVSLVVPLLLALAARGTAVPPEPPTTYTSSDAS
jgi:hypothetical protein